MILIIIITLIIIIKYVIGQLANSLISCNKYRNQSSLIVWRLVLSAALFVQFHFLDNTHLRAITARWTSSQLTSWHATGASRNVSNLVLVLLFNKAITTERVEARFKIGIRVKWSWDALCFVDTATGVVTLEHHVNLAILADVAGLIVHFSR